MAKKAKQDKKAKGNCYAVVVLDATGSMSGQEERVVGSMNEYVAGLPKGTHLSAFMFDTDRWIEHFDDNIKSWTPMTRADYRVGSTTPLYDAIAKAIRHGQSLAKNGDKVMVMVDTDGYENASVEHTRDSVKKLIGDCEKDGWAFLFMSGGVDRASAIAVGATASAIGIKATQTASHGVRLRSYGAAAGQTMSYFVGQGAPVSLNIDDQDDKDKVATPTGGTAGTTGAVPTSRTSDNANDGSWTRERPSWSGAA